MRNALKTVNTPTRAHSWGGLASTLTSALTALLTSRPTSTFVFAAALCILAVPSIAAPKAAAQSRFDTPEAAASALIAAVKADDATALQSILGPHTGRLITSGDPTADAQNRETLVRAYTEANKIALGRNRAELIVGYDEWPLPIPLVMASDGKWYFDTRSGEAEILARRIGANELAAIQVCQAIVDAQREFAARDADGDGLREFAPRFTSSPGKRDGLYWPTTADEAPSPLGLLLAAAAKDGYISKDASLMQPYHGYFYKILTRQGRDAQGGPYSYFVNGKFIAGFALVAFPARHGASGIMSFIVNQDGVVFQKNLGRQSSAIASAMMTFNPDPSWTPVPVRTTDATESPNPY